VLPSIPLSVCPSLNTFPCPQHKLKNNLMKLLHTHNYISLLGSVPSPFSGPWLQVWGLKWRSNINFLEHKTFTCLEHNFFKKWYQIIWWSQDEFKVWNGGQRSKYTFILTINSKAMVNTGLQYYISFREDRHCYCATVYLVLYFMIFPIVSYISIEGGARGGSMSLQHIYS